MKYIRHIFIIILLLLNGSAAFAGNTGKIAGKVTDKQTGEPLIGANIMVKGTSLGAAADMEGNYYILQVPPGRYEVMASVIGYHNMTIENVRVQVDLTTRLNFEMESRAIEFPTLTVVAEEPLVQMDITSTRKKTAREEIEAMPGMEQTLDIFNLYGGAIVASAPQSIQLGDGSQLQVRDESLKDVHIRGGRGGEILYMVDGMPVTHPIYGGRDVLDLNVVDVETVELLTGAFNAEYGQAQSGVVNITTRSGGDTYKGGVEYKNDKHGIISESYDTHYASFYFGGPEPITGTLLPGLGLKIPGEMSFFISSNFNLTNTTHNNHRDRDKISVLGLKFTEKQNNTGNFNAKLNWNMTDQLNFTLSYHGSWKRWSNFNWLWLYYPNHSALYTRDNHNVNFKVTHTLSNATFYNLNFGFLSVAYQGSLDGQQPPDFWTFYKDSVGYDYWDYTGQFSGAPDYKTGINSPQTDPLTLFYDNLGFENIWRDDYTETFTIKGDITSQVHPEHLVKSGLEIQFNDLRYVDIQDGGTTLSNYGKYLYEGAAYAPPPPGPFKPFGQNRWVFDVKPIIGGAFIQDKFEKESLIINAGLRMDWFLTGKTINQQDWKNAWIDATGLTPTWKSYKYKFSPRFGISFPISLETVVFFSYGHFNQLPELQYYYRDPWTGSFAGNPHLDYEQTILYEFGFTHKLFQNWAIDIKSYTKDISQQVQTTFLTAARGTPVYLYDNKGYARARGLEFELRKRYSNFTSGKLTYTVQWANGYSSSAFDDYIRSTTDFPNPIRERRLNWDIRHQVIFQGTIAAPANHNLRLFGLKLPDNWNLTVLSKFSSGKAYTPGTLDPAEAQKKENSETGPPILTTDFKLNKSFTISGLELSVFADVFNLFNHRNVQIEYGFNPWTGKPYKYGDLVAPTHQYYNYYAMFNLMDPRQFSAARTVKVGIRIDW